MIHFVSYSKSRNKKNNVTTQNVTLIIKSVFLEDMEFNLFWCNLCTF